MTNSSPVSQDDHFKFVASLITDDKKKYFAIFEDELLLATINISYRTDDEWERGIVVSPCIQGRHITEILEKMMYQRYHQMGCKSLYAKVLKDNARSIHYHRKIGYKLQEEDNKYNYYKLTL